MLQFILWSVLVIAPIKFASSIQTQERLSLSEVCNLRNEIANICKGNYMEIESQICKRSESTYNEYFLDCDYISSEERTTILILNRGGFKYFCSMSLVPGAISLSKNMTSYELEYFNCDLLQSLGQLNQTEEHRYRSLQYHERKVQSSCNIGLNLYSVFYMQVPLPNNTYILNVMNQCSLEYSWLCKDSNTQDVMQSNEYDLFRHEGSNSYLSAQYEFPQNKESYSMEVLSLYRGGIRRQCWGNNSFRGVPITSEMSNLYFTNNGRVTINRYNTTTPSCRVMGYYQAKATALVNIKFYVNGTANAWIFDDSINPNFPNIQNRIVYEAKMNLVKDQLYFVRFDLIYLAGSSGLYTFNVIYPNINTPLVNPNELFYPVRTDYSPLNSSSLDCNNSYYIPVPETNGDILCPSDNLECNKLTYTKRITNDSLDKLCDIVRWENGIQICEKCKFNSMVYDNECICLEHTYLDRDSGACVRDGMLTTSIFLHKVSSI